MCPKSCEHEPIALGRHGRPPDRGHEASASASATTSTLLPEGGGWLLVEFGGDDKRGIRRQGAGADGCAEKSRTTRRR